MTDNTPPRPQDVEPIEYDEKLWESILSEEPPRCAECGVELQGAELERKDAGKFTDMCDGCCRLKLGLE